MDRLTTADKVLCVIYGVLGLVALIWTQVIVFGGHVSSDDGSLVDQMVANGVATFMLIDLLAVAFVALVFMVAEGRRIGMRFLWVYVLLTFIVAISVSLPLFLIVRQFHLAGQRTSTAA